MTVVLTCVDARADPTYFAGVDLCDAIFFLRNVGFQKDRDGRTRGVVLLQLMKLGAGGTAPNLNVRSSNTPIAAGRSSHPQGGRRDWRQPGQHRRRRRQSAGLFPSAVIVSGHLY